MLTPEVAGQVQEILKDRNLDSVIRNGAQCVQEILRQAPWNLSKDFVQAAELRMPLQVPSFAMCEEQLSLFWN